jgi:tRNA-specific 2-thiouridylase
VAGELNWLAPKPSKDFIPAEVKIRYNHPQASAKVVFLRGSRVQVDFKEPQAAITPGQFAVFYKGDIVLGGAKILSAA